MPAVESLDERSSCFTARATGLERTGNLRYTVCASVRARVRACLRVCLCVRTCVRACMCVFVRICLVGWRTRAPAFVCPSVRGRVCMSMLAMFTNTHEKDRNMPKNRNGTQTQKSDGELFF